MSKQLFYHFLSAKDALDDLANARIKVSDLNSLNDLFEFMPYRRYGFKERQPYGKMFQAISKKWGVLSFSKTWTGQLLWAHYADKHRGSALGFEIAEEKLLKVDYVSTEIRNKFDLIGDFEKNEQSFLNQGRIKFREWSYEKEYRLLVNLDDCKLENNMYFFYFGDKLRLKKIVLGCRFDLKKYKEKIINSAKRLNVKTIIVTRPGFEDYRIHRCGTRTPQLQKLLR